MLYTVYQKGKRALRIYEDSRPHALKSRDIQKGLILVYNGQEICGEGIGFGAPVVKYTDKTYFPMKATLAITTEDSCTNIVKVFEINSVFRIKIWGRHINIPLLSFFTELFSKVHREHRRLRRLLDVLLAWLRQCMRRPADLVITTSKGWIAVTYKIYEDNIFVQVDTSQLNKTDCREICIMNEQGADFFRKYTDTNAASQTDDDISSWEKVEADEAYFADSQKRVSFGLTNVSRVDLYRGRECFEGHLAWAGFAYSLPPELDAFEYNIRLQGE
jgi:hypothetical protein